MNEVETALESYLAGDLDRDALLDVLNRSSASAPAALEQLEQTLIDLRHKDRLSAEELTLFVEPIKRAATETRPKPIEQHADVGAVFRNRFVLEEEIGRGGMGIVYRARDLRREEASDRQNEVAIKVIGRHLQHHPDAFISLQREARRAQQLAHPNIATVYDFDREGDVAYLCMELLRGKPLNAILNNKAGLRKEEAFSIIRGISDGLAYAHERSIVHTDLKPGNIFLTDRNIVKILDFGLARTLRSPDQTAPETSFDAGRWNAMTPAYASCEMFEHLDPDPRDDIYALACVAYELLTGTHPFNRLPAPQARESRLSPKPVRGLTRKQNKALRQGLAFARADRCASVKEFREALTKTSSVMPTAIAVAVGALAVVATIGLSWLYIDSDATNADPTAGRSTAPTGGPVLEAERETINDPSILPAAPDRPLPEPAPVDAQTLESINNVLNIADLHFAVGRVIEPKGSNAAEAYLAVLELQPGNHNAMAGIEKVADKLVEDAQKLLADGDKDAALALTATGLELIPDHERLAALRTQLQTDG